MPDYDVETIPISLALVVPACRTLAVTVSAQEADTGGWACYNELVPVLAIQATIETSFSRNRVRGRYDVPATVQSALRSGWGVNETPQVKVEAIVADPDYELSPASLDFDGCNLVFGIVAAPWDPSEDSERLTRTIKDLGRRAIEKAEREPRRPISVPSCPTTTSPIAVPSGDPAGVETIGKKSYVRLSDLKALRSDT